MMIPLKARELRTALLRKGFVEEQGDHRWLRLYVGSRRTDVRTPISHGIPEYGVNLLKKVAQQLHLDQREFMDLVRCPLSRSAYADLMRKQGHV